MSDGNLSKKRKAEDEAPSADEETKSRPNPAQNVAECPESTEAGKEEIEHMQLRDENDDHTRKEEDEVTNNVAGASKENTAATEKSPGYDTPNPPHAIRRSKENESKEAENDQTQNPYEKLRWMIVKNDGRPVSLIKLIALKSLFSKQLPKMPKAYIARLVFERRHISLVILSDDPKVKDTDKEVIGSICYRPFPEMRFAEIAFCAVNSDHQVKVSSTLAKIPKFIVIFSPTAPTSTFSQQGYGTKLMNLLKKEGARTGIEFFITYADNYAIGYFKKQGFSKTVSMPKGRYHGLIKDYDGGTMMECYVHPTIDYTRIPEMLTAQREYILSRIRIKANSTRIYEPLPKGFNPNLEGVSRANESAARALAIPGMIEAGWTMTDLLSATGQGKEADRAKNALKNEMIQIVRKVDEQQYAWPFREPVNTSEVKVCETLICSAVCL